MLQTKNLSLNKNSENISFLSPYCELSCTPYSHSDLNNLCTMYFYHYILLMVSVNCKIIHIRMIFETIIVSDIDKLSSEKLFYYGIIFYLDPGFPAADLSRSLTTMLL